MSFDLVPLGEVTQFFNNKRVPVTKSDRVKGQYPYYGAAGIQGYVSDFIFEGSYILVGEDGTVTNGSGNPIVQRAEGRFWVNNHAHVIQPNDDADFDYLFYAISVASVGDLVTGAVQPKLSMTNLKQMLLPWASDLEVRRTIGRIFRAFDSRIEINSSTAETLESIAQTLFRSWFVDFDPVRAKMAGEKPVGMDDATAALFPDSMEESVLGDIPAGWEVTSVGEFCPLKYGKSLPAPQRQPGSVPVYGSNGIVGDHSVSLLEAPAVIIGRKGTVGSVTLSLDPCWVIDTAFYCAPERGENLPLAYLSLQGLGLENMNSDAAVPGLNRENAHRLLFAIANEPIRARFAEIVGSIFAKIHSIQAEVNSVVSIRDALLPRLISGELQVPEDLVA